MKARLSNVVFLAVVVVGGGCRREMFEQPRGNPLGESKYFENGMASRPIPPHTISQNDGPQFDESFRTGMIGTNLVDTFPIPVTREILERGRACFEINCAPCHGHTGEGNGIVVERGFPAPPSYHIERLREAPAGHFFDVMTRGYGAMLSQAERVTPLDRWAIAAYIRALQLSEHASYADVPTNEMVRLENSP